ncbi:Cubilin [Acropora cervicornis]|uniref:Cubilin n=1 Tax=Acropora cervicornis TaxID=6130 RepID=A0AAD9Q1B6_ACRCE|nr:Cubilin [Acropora cervicornis]
MDFRCSHRGFKTALVLKLLFMMLLEIEAESFHQTPENCDKNVKLEGDTGSFTNPGGYKGYSNNTYCSWVIYTVFNGRIEVTFHDFDLEWSKTCKPYDYVRVTDKCNGSSTWSENLEDEEDGYCGKREMFRVTSRCNNIRIEFKSDDSLTGKGFNATYKIIRDLKKPEIVSFCENKTANCSEMKEATQGETIRLLCNLYAYPVAEVEWYVRGLNKSGADQQIDTLQNRMQNFRNGTLVIHNLRRNDTGWFRCFASNTVGNDSATVYLRVKEYCKCPKTIHANWYSIPPYIRGKGSYKPGGLFPLLLEKIVARCCGNCTGGDGESEISYVNRRDNLVDIKKSENLNELDTITFPISGKKGDREYQNNNKFMPLIGSPGVAFIVVDDPPGTSANAVFNSVLSGWPVLVLTLLMALLSGIVMWSLDTWYNPDEFPRSFIKGSAEGFWWAFVTMTTVGYGDRSPRGPASRIFAIFWVLIGLVITSIFTGVVTTSLTAITLSTDVKIYGTKIGAVANSTEYRLGINKNARMEPYHDLESIVKPLKDRNLKGALIDTYVAGEMSELNSPELRVNKIIDHNTYYGVVFGQGRLAKRKFQECFEDYVLSNQADIFKTVKEKTTPMEKPKESAAVERSSGLFDASSNLYQNSVYTCVGLLLFFAACGLIWDYGYMRHWKKKVEMEELELLGGPGYEMAKRNLDMMDSLMHEVQEFYENWTKRLDEMTLKHEEQQRQQAKQKK